MKLIIAYIQPHKLNDVKQALYKAEVHKMSVTNALGCGEQKGYHESYRGVEFEVNLLKKVRLEIAVNEEFADKAIAKGYSTVSLATHGHPMTFAVQGKQGVRLQVCTAVEPFLHVGLPDASHQDPNAPPGFAII